MDATNKTLITIPYQQNADRQILLALQIFISLKEMTLVEARNNLHEFLLGKDLLLLVNSDKVKKIEDWLFTSGHEYVINNNH